MTGLMDIAPVIRTVKTSFGEVTITGLSISGIIHIVRNNPELIDLIKNNKNDTISYADLLDVGIDVAASFLASGMGYVNNLEAEERCKQLKPDDAFVIAQAIMEESFPDGIKSFFDRVSKEASKLKIKTQPLDTKNSLSK